MIPIGDDNSDRRTKPYVTYAFSTVPSEILSVVDPSTGERAVVPGLGRTPLSVYLFIFGDNVEDGLGHVRFLLFSLFCGAAASLAHVFAT